MFDLLHAAGAVESLRRGEAAAVGLSLPKLAALNRLVTAGDSMPLGQFAERLKCVKSNVTQLVDRLEADGLVTRAPDPNDRRSRLAVITEQGKSSTGRAAGSSRMRSGRCSRSCRRTMAPGSPRSSRSSRRQGSRPSFLTVVQVCMVQWLTGAAIKQ